MFKSFRDWSLLTCAASAFYFSGYLLNASGFAVTCGNRTYMMGSCIFVAVGVAALLCLIFGDEKTNPKKYGEK